MRTYGVGVLAYANATSMAKLAVTGALHRRLARYLPRASALRPLGRDVPGRSRSPGAHGAIAVVDRPRRDPGRLGRNRRGWECVRAAAVAVGPRAASFTAASSRVATHFATVSCGSGPSAPRPSSAPHLRSGSATSPGRSDTARCAVLQGVPRGSWRVSEPLPTGRARTGLARNGQPWRRRWRRRLDPEVRRRLRCRSPNPAAPTSATQDAVPELSFSALVSRNALSCGSGSVGPLWPPCWARRYTGNSSPQCRGCHAFASVDSGGPSNRHDAWRTMSRRHESVADEQL